MAYHRSDAATAFERYLVDAVARISHSAPSIISAESPVVDRWHAAVATCDEGAAEIAAERLYRWDRSVFSSGPPLSLEEYLRHLGYTSDTSPHLPDMENNALWCASAAVSRFRELVCPGLTLERACRRLADAVRDAAPLAEDVRPRIDGAPVRVLDLSGRAEDGTALFAAIYEPLFSGGAERVVDIDSARARA